MKGKRAPQRREPLAELVFLSRALNDLSLPVQLAEQWLGPSDLSELVERVRSLLGFVDGYLTKYSENIRQAQRGEDAQLAEDALVVEQELATMREQLRLFDRLRASQARAANDFSAEAEQLRKLRSGELKIEDALRARSGSRGNG